MIKPSPRTSPEASKSTIQRRRHVVRTRCQWYIGALRWTRLAGSLSCRTRNATARGFTPRYVLVQYGVLPLLCILSLLADTLCLIWDSSSESVPVLGDRSRHDFVPCLLHRQKYSLTTFRIGSSEQRSRSGCWVQFPWGASKTDGGEGIEEG